jgi:hypothetical protein
MLFGRQYRVNRPRLIGSAGSRTNPDGKHTNERIDQTGDHSSWSVWQKLDLETGIQASPTQLRTPSDFHQLLARL